MLRYSLPIAYFLLSQLTLTASTPTETSIKPPSEGMQLTADYNLAAPFDPNELKNLAENRKLDRSQNRRLQHLLLRAGLEKNKDFLYLLNQTHLRSSKDMRLALAGYDYMINQTPSSLNPILAELATENIGADSDAIVVLSVLDEWDRTIRAFRKHFVRTDGAGAHCMANFKAVRAYLYPEKYKQHKTQIEAPIIWQTNLMPDTTNKPNSHE